MNTLDLRPDYTILIQFFNTHIDPPTRPEKAFCSNTINKQDLTDRINYIVYRKIETITTIFDEAGISFILKSGFKGKVCLKNKCMGNNCRYLHEETTKIVLNILWSQYSHIKHYFIPITNISINIFPNGDQPVIVGIPPNTHFHVHSGVNPQHPSYQTQYSPLPLSNPQESQPVFAAANLNDGSPEPGAEIAFEEASETGNGEGSQPTARNEEEILEAFEKCTIDFVNSIIDNNEE